LLKGCAAIYTYAYTVCFLTNDLNALLAESRGWQLAPNQSTMSIEKNWKTVLKNTSKVKNWYYINFDQGISVASFCHQVAALEPDKFCNFYLVKNYKIANYSETSQAREKMSPNLESLEFYKTFWGMFDQILLNKN
jgi:hypothetical protein